MEKELRGEEKIFCVKEIFFECLAGRRFFSLTTSLGSLRSWHIHIYIINLLIVMSECIIPTVAVDPDALNDADCENSVSTNVTIWSGTYCDGPNISIDAEADSEDDDFENAELGHNASIQLNKCTSFATTKLFLYDLTDLTDLTDGEDLVSPGLSLEAADDEDDKDDKDDKLSVISGLSSHDIVDESRSFPSFSKYFRQQRGKKRGGKKCRDRRIRRHQKMLTRAMDDGTGGSHHGPHGPHGPHGSQSATIFDVISHVLNHESLQ